MVISSDNRESMKRLARVLGNQPMVSVALADADTETALSMVGSRLLSVVKGRSEEGREGLTREEIEKIEKLGGRSSDLQNVRPAFLLFFPASGYSLTLYYGLSRNSADIEGEQRAVDLVRGGRHRAADAERAEEERVRGRQRGREGAEVESGAGVECGEAAGEEGGGE